MAIPMRTPMTPRTTSNSTKVKPEQVRGTVLRIGKTYRRSRARSGAPSVLAAGAGIAHVLDQGNHGQEERNDDCADHHRKEDDHQRFEQ